MGKHRVKVLLIVVLVISIVSIVSYKVYSDNKEISKTESNKTMAVYINEGDGSYDLSSSSSFPTTGYTLNTEKSKCTNGGVLSQDSTTKKISVTVTSSDKCNLYFDKLSIIKSIKASAKSGTPDFSSAATTDEGIYAAEDDYGTSYYFRGAVENNYVYFAGFYWRIIRINGDGSLRIIYDGTSAHANGESSTDRLISTSTAFNSSYSDNAYVGYMYGTAGASTYEDTHANTNSSTIKQYIDSWYETNIEGTEYESAISDTLFCGDRSLDTTSSSYTGIGTATTYYGALQRLYTNKSPILTCPQKNDAYTVSDTTNGNGALTYPIALISADEIAMAGGVYGDGNSSYYLYTGQWYWTASPAYFYSSRLDALVWLVSSSGSLYDKGASNDLGVRPVVNLTAEYVSTMSGTGTMTDPYTVE